MVWIPFLFSKGNVFPSLFWLCQNTNYPEKRQRKAYEYVVQPTVRCVAHYFVTVGLSILYLCVLIHISTEDGENTV